MAILTEKPHEWESYQRELPPGFIPITTKDVMSHPEILKAARHFIDTNVRANKPIGYREQSQIGGRQILFTIEPYCHEPNGPTKPWGWHKACSVSVEAPHYDYGPQPGSEMGAEMNTKVKTGLTYGVPAVVGFFFLGPIGAALGAAGGAAWHHFKK